MNPSDLGLETGMPAGRTILARLGPCRSGAQAVDPTENKNGTARVVILTEAAVSASKSYGSAAARLRPMCASHAMANQ